MGLLDIFRVTPPERSVTRRKVRDEPGPLTAHQARDLVWPIARALDSAARLTLLTRLARMPPCQTFTLVLIHEPARC